MTLELGRFYMRFGLGCWRAQNTARLEPFGAVFTLYVCMAPGDGRNLSHNKQYNNVSSSRMRWSGVLFDSRSN